MSSQDGQRPPRSRRTPPSTRCDATSAEATRLRAELAEEQKRGAQDAADLEEILENLPDAPPGIRAKTNPCAEHPSAPVIGGVCGACTMRSHMNR